MFTSSYDYTDYVLRTDPTCPVTSAQVNAAAASRLDLGAAFASTFTATLPAITGIWTDVSPDAAALKVMIGVAMHFADVAEARGIAGWADVSPEHIRDFVYEVHPEITADVRRLRKNTVHACYLALIDAGLHDDLSPAAGIDPVVELVRDDERGKRLGDPQPTKTRRRYAERVHVRPASHDELILTRLATRLAGTSRTTHLSAAAVAICSSSATTTEGAQVLCRDLTDAAAIALGGREVETGREETAIAPRTLSLDAWAAQALADWRAESGRVRPVDPGASVAYSGKQALTSNSAQVGVDQQVRKALHIADLRREPGLTAGSLRLWAAACLVTDFTTLAAGAAVAGVDPLTLHRQITQQGERGLRLNY